LDEPVDQFEAELLVDALAAAEAELDAHFHAAAEELGSLVQLDGEVVRIDPRAKLHLFHLAAGVPRLLVAFGLLVKKLAVLHQPADGRDGVGGDLDQIQSLAMGQAKGVAQSHNPELLFGFVQHAHLAGANLAVPAVLRLAGWKRS